jgi:hypothetical protein
LAVLAVALAVFAGTDDTSFSFRLETG